MVAEKTMKSTEIGSGKSCLSFGAPFIMNWLFLKGMEVRVKDNDEFSEPFPDTNGVK